MKKWLLTIVFGAALVLGACGGSDDADGGSDSGEDGGDAEVSQGEEAYQDNCLSCHGGDLQGISGADITSHSADEIEEIIENGIGGMPAQSQVSDDDRTAIAEWLSGQ